MEGSPSSFVIHEDSRMQYAGFFLLKEMADRNQIFSSNLEDDECVLESIFVWLAERNFIELTKHQEFHITAKGFDQVNSFLDRYATFLAEYDIFCGVDWKAKDFAMCYLDRFQDSLEWHTFLRDERWDDLRVAIAEYQGLDAIEIVFMGFIHEGRFGRDQNGWHHDLLLGSIWDEIQAICNNSIRLRSLSKHFSVQTTSPEHVLQEIIDKGHQVMEELTM